MWQGDIPDVGCSITSGCSSNDGLLVSPFIDSNGEIVVNWVAKDKDFPLPYVCQSKCPRYYIWVTGNKAWNMCKIFFFVHSKNMSPEKIETNEVFAFQFLNDKIYSYT